MILNPQIMQVRRSFGTHSFKLSLSLALILLCLVPARAGTELEYVACAGGKWRDCVIEGDIAYLAEGNAISIIEISNREAVQCLSRYRVPPYAAALAVQGTVVYAALHQRGIEVIDASDPRRPRRAMFLKGENNYDSMTIDGPLLIAYSHYGSSSFHHIYHIGDPLHPRRVADNRWDGENCIYFPGSFAVCGNDIWSEYTKQQSLADPPGLTYLRLNGVPVSEEPFTIVVSNDGVQCLDSKGHLRELPGLTGKSSDIGPWVTDAAVMGIRHWDHRIIEVEIGGTFDRAELEHRELQAKLGYSDDQRVEPEPIESPTDLDRLAPLYPKLEDVLGLEMRGEKLILYGRYGDAEATVIQAQGQIRIGEVRDVPDARDWRFPPVSASATASENYDVSYQELDIDKETINRVVVSPRSSADTVPSPNHAEIVIRLATGEEGLCYVGADRNYLYLNDRDGYRWFHQMNMTLQLYDLRGPFVNKPVFEYGGLSGPLDVATRGEYFYVADGEGGLVVLRRPE